MGSSAESATVATMSACNRNKSDEYAEAHAMDFFETPESAIRPLLPELGEPRTALDLGCGTGALGKALTRGLGCPGLGEPRTLRLTGIEIDVDRAKEAGRSGFYNTVHRADALSIESNQNDRFDLVLSNPPFSHAMEFVQRGIELTRPGGITAMLLRLGFLASKKRRFWHRANPCDVFVLSERPSFTGNGKTDACDYGWFLFGLGRGGRWSVL